MWRDCKPNGGILGHLKAWTGTVELTERGSFHGHFFIWLLGGMDPSDIHLQLQIDFEFEKHFFSYFENISCHSLPNVDYYLDTKFKPRIQWPPIIPEDFNEEDIIKEWSEEFIYEIKSCGDVLQRHVCRYILNMVMKLNVILCFPIKFLINLILIRKLNHFF